MLALPFLLRTCVPSLWSPLFLLQAPALIPLFFTKVRLSLILTLFLLLIWYTGQTALCLFLLAKAALTYSVALRPLFPFQQTQYAQVFSLNTALFCKLFVLVSAAPTSLPFLFSYLTLALYLNLSDRNCLLSPVLSSYKGSTNTRFSRGTTRLMSWSNGRATRTLRNLL